MDPLTAFVHERYNHSLNVEIRLSFLKARLQSHGAWLTLAQSVTYDLNQFIAEDVAFNVWELLIERSSCNWDRWRTTSAVSAIDCLTASTASCGSPSRLRTLTPKHTSAFDLTTPCSLTLIPAQLFTKRIIKLDSRMIATAAVDCAEKYFVELNFPAATVLGAKLDEYPPLVGLEYIWSIALEV